jgi:hypothetical protein
MDDCSPDGSGSEPGPGWVSFWLVASFHRELRFPCFPGLSWSINDFTQYLRDLGSGSMLLTSHLPVQGACDFRRRAPFSP